MDNADTGFRKSRSSTANSKAIALAGKKKSDHDTLAPGFSLVTVTLQCFIPRFRGELTLNSIG
jgi:hypothetical protein